MTGNLKPYPAYKESGSSWIGLVPSSWEVHNLRTLIEPHSERNHPELPLLSVAREKGVFIRSLTGEDDNHNILPEDLSNYKVARAGNLVINKMKAWQGSMGIAPCDGVVSPAYYVFEFCIANASFGEALLRSKPYVAHFGQASDGVRIGQWDLNIARMREIPVLIPSPDEQACIARYLSYADRRVRRYVRSKQKLIKLLEEHRQAVFHRVITRGLTPGVPFKPSGVLWLGEIPRQWEVRKIRTLSSRVTKGTTPTTLGRDFTASGINFVKVESISKTQTLLQENFAHIDEATNALLMRSQLVDGDVLIAIAGAIGRVGIVRRQDLPANTNQAVGIISPMRRSVLPEWLALVLSSPACQRYLVDNSVQSAQANLSLANLGRTMIPVPGLAEQQQLVKETKSLTNAINSAIEAAKTQISLMIEYRSRLVSNVVTGKLDVRDAANSLPDDSREEEIVHDDVETLLEESLEDIESDLDAALEEVEV